jgi:hypothetical protein
LTLQLQDRKAVLGLIRVSYAQAIR